MVSIEDGVSTAFRGFVLKMKYIGIQDLRPYKTRIRAFGCSKNLDGKPNKFLSQVLWGLRIHEDYRFD